MSDEEDLARILADLQVYGPQYFSAAGAQLLAQEIRRLQNQEERLNMARQVLVEDGYFREDEVGDDLAPRLGEWLIHKRSIYRAPVEVDMRIDENALWRAILPRLEAWADDRTRRQIQASGRQAAQFRAGAYKGWSQNA